MEVGKKLTAFLFKKNTQIEFLNPVEENNLTHLIKSLEMKTTGEIRVHLDILPLQGNIMSTAVSIFKKLSMYQTKRRNGVLIYVNIPSKGIAIIGDQAIHEKMRQTGWEQAIETAVSHLKDKKNYEGLKSIIESVGKVLERFFPKNFFDNDENELTNEISKS